jgi:RNA polymerase sigma-70 factor (ECF subfamily)
MLIVRAGKLDKLGLLFERYNRKLFSYFYRLTCRHDISEDLVQGVFERIIKYRHTYENGDAFSTWIYRIARNLHADHHRNNSLEEQLNEPADPDRFEGVSMENERDENEDRKLQLLEKALTQLEPVKKETLVLSRYQGFKYKEIAAIMDCTESAVKVRIFRAIDELRQIITELDQQDYE